MPESDKIDVRRGGREMELPAVVRWTDKNGMGVQFLLVGARDTHEISEFVVASGRPRPDHACERR
jgi:hypothetical protein